MTLHQSTLCHVLQEHGDSGPCFIRHPQFFVDVSGTETAVSAILHRENRQDRPLVGVAEGAGIGESGAEHCSLVVNFSQYRHPQRPNTVTRGQPSNCHIPFRKSASASSYSSSVSNVRRPMVQGKVRLGAGVVGMSRPLERM